MCIWYASAPEERKQWHMEGIHAENFFRQIETESPEIIYLFCYCSLQHTMQKSLHWKKNCIMYYVVYKNPHLMLNFLDVFSEICLNKFILSVDPQNTKIFTHQKRISEHLVMNSKYCLFWIDLASIWKYMSSFFCHYRLCT